MRQCATYTEKKQDRDLQAHALYTGQALVGEKLIGHPEALSVINDPVSLFRRVMKDPEITVTAAQMAAHHKAYLSHLAEKESFKGYEVAHEKIVAYRQGRNFAAASFKDLSQAGSFGRKDHEAQLSRDARTSLYADVSTTSPQDFSTQNRTLNSPWESPSVVLQKLLEKRDRLAFEIFDALGQDPGITKVVKNLLSTDRDEDKILNHAIRGEVKKVLDLYRETPDLGTRGKYAAWLASHEEGRGILRDNGERPTALLFEAKAIEAFLSTERTLEAQTAFKDKILAWKQEDQPHKELGDLESGQEEKSFKIAVGDSRVLRLPSVDLSALNEAICNSADLERLGRDLGLLRGKGRSESKGKVRYGTKGSFVIDRNKNLWHDFESGTGGNAFSMLKEAGHSSAYKEKVRTLSDYTDGFVSREIESFLGGQERSSDLKRAFEARQQEREKQEAEARKIEQEQTAQKHAAIQDLVKKSVPLEGTQAETYLRRTRGLSGPFPESLRYLEPGTSFLYPGSATPKRFSRGAMATLSRDKDGDLKAVQVTYLDGQGGRGRDPDGHKLPKITYGNPKGAFVDLSTEKLDPKVTPIFLAEGVETALSVKQAGAQRVMASLGLTNLKDQELEAPQVVLCGDWDGKPELPRPLKEAQKVLQEKGQGGEIVLPVTSGQEKKDFNDLLLEGGVEKVQDRLKSLLTVSLYSEKQQPSLELLEDETNQNEQDYDYQHDNLEKNKSPAHDPVRDVPSEEKPLFKTPEPLSPTPQESPSVDTSASQKAETLVEEQKPTSPQVDEELDRKLNRYDFERSRRQSHFKTLEREHQEVIEFLKQKEKEERQLWQERYDCRQASEESVLYRTFKKKERNEAERRYDLAEEDLKHLKKAEITTYNRISKAYRDNEAWEKSQFDEQVALREQKIAILEESAALNQECAEELKSFKESFKTWLSAQKKFGLRTKEAQQELDKKREESLKKSQEQKRGFQIAYEL